MAKGKILSVLLITLGLLFAAGQAQAQGQCNMGSIDEPNGPVAIAINGDCVVNGDITARDYVSIQVLNGKITVTGNITSTQHGNVVLRATGPISVGGSIIVDNSAAPSSQAGAVDIDANTVQAGAPFVIGSASSNGVAGTINVDTVNGGGTDPFAIKGGIKIRNRGGVTLSSVAAVSAKATASKAGALIFDGVDGTVSLPTGTLSADGTGNNGAGAIILMGTEVSTQDGTVISATDNGAAGLSHFVNIGASTVSFTGANGLQIRANGGGSGTAGSFVYILPKFSVFVEDNFVPADLVWTVSYPFGVANPSPVSLNGASGSPLTVSANGTSNTQVLLSGYPLAFAGGDLALNARGQTNHRIDLTYQGQTGNIDGLVVTANKLTLNANANANAGTGGDIFASMPRPVSSSPQQVLMTADGPNNAVGAGGTIQFYPRGDVTLGASAGQFHLSAQGGMPGGNGGSIVVQNDFNTTNVASSSALQASARGGNGDGGSISAKSLFMNFNGAGLKVAADALGSGKGGRVTIEVPAGSIAVGTGAGEAKLSAEANATTGGDGGEVSINVGGSATIASGQLSVASGASGRGGKIAITAGGDLALTGSLKANAGLSGNGAGGQVLLSSSTLTLNGSPSGGGQSLSADGAGMGPGGLVSVSIQSSFTPTTIATQQQGAISLSADGGKNATGTFLGAGGTVQLTDLNAGFIIDGAALTVRSGTGQNAGSILVDAGQTLAVSGNLKAQGAGNGANGGTIRLTAQSSNPVVFSNTTTTNISADGGSNGTTGSGGHITISNAGTGNIWFQQKVLVSASAEGTGGGTAGSVEISTGGDIILSGSGNSIKVNGNGATSGENIHIESAGDLLIGGSAGQIELLAKGTVSGDRGGSVKLVSTSGNANLDSSAIDVRAGGAGPTGAQGDGGNFRVEAGGSIAASGIFQANGRGTGKGGHIGLLTGQSLNIGSAEFHVDGGNKGNGGVLELSSSTSLTIDASTLSANAGTAANSNAAAGQISISAVGVSSDLTLNGNLSVNGSGSGAGGTLGLFAGQLLDVSASELHADGASGGSISLSYGGDQSLSVLTLSATGSSVSGGTIEIQHTEDNDAVIVITGTVDTRSNGELAGLFKVLAFDEDTNAISVTVNDTGSFDSIVGAVGKSVDFTSFTFVNVGIDEVESTDGDVNFCIDGTGTCAVAVATARSPMRALQATESTLQLVKTLKVSGGLGTIRSQTCDLKPDFRATLVQSAPAINSLVLNCNNVNFAANALIDAAQTPNTVGITSIAGADLLIRLPSGSRAGIINAKSIVIEPTGLGAITVQSSAVQSSVFALGNQLGIDSGTVFRANNALTIDSKVQIGENDVNSDGLPRSLLLRTVAAPINVPSTIYALNNVTIDNSSAVSNVTIGNIDTILPEPGTTAVNITAGGTITQLPDASINTKQVVLKSTFELIGSSDAPIRISATDLEIEALGSGGGSAYVEQVDPIQITLGVCQTTGNLSIKAKGNIIINKNLHTTLGDVQILATNGVITTNVNPTFGPVITSGGGVQLAIGSFPIPPVPGTPAANVTVVPGTGGGQVYWGSTPGISATGFNTVQTNNAHDIVFEVNGVTDGIVLRGGVSITTGQ